MMVLAVKMRADASKRGRPRQASGVVVAKNFLAPDGDGDGRRLSRALDGNAIAEELVGELSWIGTRDIDDVQFADDASANELKHIHVGEHAGSGRA